MGTGKFNAGGSPAMDWHPIQGGVEISLVASCNGNRDKCRPDGPLGSYVSGVYKIYTMVYFVCPSKVAYMCEIRGLNLKL